jgi:DNA-binding transcriptional regulator YiaG
VTSNNSHIRVLRVEKGWSQEELARRVGVSLSTVQRWEANDSKPSKLAERELGRVLGKKTLISKENKK